MKKATKYKALYQLNLEHRAKETQQSRNVEDSLDSISRSSNKKLSSTKKDNERKQKSKKKSEHFRYQSYPFISSSFNNERIIPNKQLPNHENKRTLKKTSVKQYQDRKDKRNHRKNCSNTFSQDFSSISVQNLPIQELSLMLYSRNVGKEKNLKKSESQISLKTMKPGSLENGERSAADVFFQTKLSQQMKIYELNEDLKHVQKEQVNVRAKQKVLQFLAAKFEYIEKSTNKTVIIS